MDDTTKQGRPAPQQAFKKISIDDAANAVGATDEFVQDPDAHEDEGIGAGTALAMYSSKVELDQDDIVWPRLKLIQGISPDVMNGVAKPGQWMIAGNEPMNELTIIPMLFQKRRERITKDFEILCKSQDAKVGVGDPGGVCEKCSMAQFSGPRNARKAPECALVYSYLVWVVELGTVAMLDFKKTSAPIGKLVNTVAAQKGLGNFALKLGHRQQSSKAGAYMVPQVNPIQVAHEVLATAREALSSAGI
jgi:hypothetical protein